MLLAIDVGNTDTKLGWYDGAQWVRIDRHPTGTWQPNAVGSEAVALVSVVPAETERLRKALPSLWELRHESVSFPIHYSPPSALGTDRLANAIALSRGPVPAVGIDCGTATKFDVVTEQGFVGGAIMPGIGLWKDALFGGRTAQLSPVLFAEPGRAIGRSTDEALRSGIVLGYVGAVRHLLAQIEKELGSAPRLVLTGGQAPLANIFGLNAQTVPTLTLDGLQIAFRLAS